jgi:UDP-N-acetylglucosamine 2-epimerase
MTSKEALKKLEYFTNWSSDEDIDKDLYNLWGNVACRTIKKDLERLEKLKKENKEFKKANKKVYDMTKRFEKAILDRFEKLEKAIKIINIRKVNVAIFKQCDTAKEYNEFGFIELLEEDFSLLKEVLED